MEKQKKINIAIKFAEIDNTPYAGEERGWVSSFVSLLEQTLTFYYRQPPAIHLLKATDLIDDNDFNVHDAIIYIISPAFIFSSNINKDISLIEKALFFDSAFINARIYKVLKGPVNTEELPDTISMGRFYHFYQSGSLTGSQYETLYEGNRATPAHAKYWQSLTSLVFDVLKQFGHEKNERFCPSAGHTVYLGNSGMGQLWNRNRLYEELNARGFNILPDHNASIEVKHLKEPVKFYLKKCSLAIYFPEEFLPLNEQGLQELTDLSHIRRLIWFDPEAEKDLEKKKQCDELKLQLKNLEHVEAISAGLEELKETIFAAVDQAKIPEEEKGGAAQPSLYLICSDHFGEAVKAQLILLLEKMNVRLLLPGDETGNEKRAQHYQYLKQADCSLICYAGKSPEWVRANINEVKKAAGLHAGKRKPIRLGIVTAGEALKQEAAGYAPGIPLMTALSPTLAEELNDYVYGK